MEFPFEPRSKVDWLSKVNDDLKGKPIQDLDWQVSKGIRVSPFAHADDIQTPYAPIQERQHNNWFIHEDIPHNGNDSEANRLAHIALNGGVTSLSFELASPCDFEVLLQDINLEWIFLHLETSIDVIHDFVEYVKRKSFNSEHVRCSFNLDSESVARTIISSLPAAKLYECKHSIQKNNPEKEIAELLVHAVAHFNNSSEAEGNADQLYFIINLGDSFYLNIAKIRALKLLWTHMLSSSGIPIIAPFIKAQMSQHTFSEDQDTTKIKAGAQAIAASIAGVDIIHIPPSTMTDDLEFHTRIARNMSHLLQLESFMNRVIDPTAGSYYLEQLTDTIATSAWTIFQQTYEQQL